MFQFSNIASHKWLSVCIIAEDISSAVKKFNFIWGSNVRYDVRPVDDVPVVTQVLV